MKTLSVPGIHCSGCVSRIEKAMKAEGIAAQVSLEDKTVTVAEADAARAVEALDDLGFEAK